MKYRIFFASTLVAIILFAVSVGWNMIGAKLGFIGAASTSFLAFVFGWTAIYLYNRGLRVKVIARLRLESTEQAIGYWQLAKTSGNRWLLWRLLLADYTAYFLTQIIPLVVSLLCFGASWADIAVTAGPVFVASLPLAVLLGVLIRVCDNIFGVEAPKSNEGLA